jgi:hypothetical protein
MKKFTRYSHLTMEPFNKQIEAPPDLNRPAINPAMPLIEPPPAATPPPASPASHSASNPATSPAAPSAPPAAPPSAAAAPPSGQPATAPETTHRTYTMKIPVVDPRDRARIAREIAERQAKAVRDEPQATAEQILSGNFTPDAPPEDYDQIFKMADIVSKYLTKIAELKPAVHRPLPPESLAPALERRLVRPGFTGARAPVAHHSRRCLICKHPDRETIEFSFIRWDSVDWIARKYRVDRQVLYRHAHALNLFERRSRNVSAVLEKLMEDACIVRATPASIIQAVRAYSRITDHVKWVEPPQTHIRAESPSLARRKTRFRPKANKKRTTLRKSRKSKRRRAISNRYKSRLKNRANHAASAS